MVAVYRFAGSISMAGGCGQDWWLDRWNMVGHLLSGRRGFEVESSFQNRTKQQETEP
jgi:hypothetical protein